MVRVALHLDRARIQTGKISRFGLLELSRQRLQPSLGETSYITCPRCAGTGHVRSTESFALHLLRMLQEESMKENTGAVHVQIPVDVATFLLNEKRHEILSIEARHRVEVVLIPNMHFETPRYTLIRLRHDQLNQSEISAPSYRMVEKPSEEEEIGQNGAAIKPERAQPVVQGITPSQPAPTRAEVAPVAPVAEHAKPGLFGRIFGWLRGLNEPEETAKPVEEAKPATAPRRSEREPRRGRPGRESREGRGDRNERGERRPRGDRPESAERPPRGERPDKREGRENREPRDNREPREPRENREPREARENREPREQREPRGERGERQERPRRDRAPAAEAVSAPVVAPTDSDAVLDASATEDREGRRRGRRGGRGRRGETASAADQTVMELVAESGDRPAPATVAAEAPLEPLVIKLEAEPAAPAPAVEAAAPVEAAPAPLSAPDLSGSGLELVETHAGTATESGVDASEEAGEQVAEETAKTPSRRRRGRGRGAGAAAAEPLVMVETRSEAGAEAEPAQTAPSEWGPPSNPRRRPRPQAAAQAAEPLVMVETRHAGEGEDKAA